MTRSVKAHADGSAPAQEQSLESILKGELSELHKEIDALVAGGMSEEEAKAILDWAAALEARVQHVASVLRDPSPANISAYLRAVASDISTVGSRRHTASSLKLLQAVLARR